MKPTFLLLCLFLVRIAYPQAIKEKDLKTEIKEVTVFLNSAQIFETGSIAVASGKTVLTIRGLPPYLDDKSIQVRGEGDFTILSVNHKLNYLSALKRDDKIDSLHHLIDGIAETLSRDNARLEVLSEKLSLLNSNKSLGGSTNGVSIAQLKQAIELYETEILKIKEEEIRIHLSVETKKKTQQKFQQQLKELNDQSIQPTSEIEISVSAANPVTARFRVTYLVSNAGWFPKYDLRVENIKEPLQITYKAEVFQNTGADWKNVKLRFSNGNPNQSGTVPELGRWNLNFARNTIYNYSDALQGRMPGVAVGTGNVHGKVLDSFGNPLPGVNVVFKGTTIGTTTDAGGNYSLTVPKSSSVLVFSFIGYKSIETPVTREDMTTAMREDVSQLQEVVTVGYGESRKQPIRIRGVSSLNNDKPEAVPLMTTTIENQTTVEIEVAEPYTIKSNGEKLLVDLKVIDAEAIYEYYAIPKMDKDAFLIARIIKWDQYNLLEGEANLYFEDAYVGRTILNAKSMEDTLNISMGRDKNIIVGREKNEQFSKRKNIGGNILESRGFKITVRNKKSQPIKITLFDQIPVSVISDIVVSADQLSGGKLDEPSGKVTWELTMDPQQQKEIGLQYEVKYPKKERVILE